MIKLEKGMFTTVPITAVEGKPPQVQTLYTRMCKYANEDGKCRPSISTLCNKTGMSKNTVIKATKFLEDMGLILKTNRCKEGEYTSNMYDVYISPIKHTGSAEDEQPSAGDEQGGSAGDEQPSAGDGNKLKQLTKTLPLTKTQIATSGDIEYKPKEITLEINQVIENIKEACKKYGTIYGPGTKERNYAKHLMSKKFKSECLDQVDMDLPQFIDAVISLNTKIKYGKPINNAVSLYYNRADSINKVKQEVTTKEKPVFYIS